MIKSLSLQMRGVLLALSIVGFGYTTQAASLAVFKGKYSGVILVKQGTAISTAGATTKVKASAKSAKFTVTIPLSSGNYIYTITLASGQATVNALFPLGSGASFGKPATGTYKAHGKSVTLSFTNPGNYLGTERITIGFTNGNSTLTISGVMALQGLEPYYSTILGG